MEAERKTSHEEGRHTQKEGFTRDRRRIRGWKGWNKKQGIKRRKRERSHVLRTGQISTSAAFNVFLGLLQSCGACECVRNPTAVKKSASPRLTVQLHVTLGSDSSRRSCAKPDRRRVHRQSCARCSHEGLSRQPLRVSRCFRRVSNGTRARLHRDRTVPESKLWSV